MSVQLKKIGGSLAVIIPVDIVREAGLEPGQMVDVFYTDGGVVAKPTVKPDWASFFARKIHPDVANAVFKREPVIEAGEYPT